MKQIEWHLDENTAFWAERIELPKDLIKAEQFSGTDKRMNTTIWEQRIQMNEFPEYCYSTDKDYVVPSITNITRCFREDHYLEGLALTIGWGAMARGKRSIYRDSLNLQQIETALAKCTDFINQDGHLKLAWTQLTGGLEGELGWGRVITSKVLHFLTRSCGYEHNPPVPFDNAVTWNQVRRWFFNSIKIQKAEQILPMPKTWWDYENSWESYNRYMTAIIVWAKRRGWQTTDVDASLFKKAMSGKLSFHASESENRE